MSVPRYVTRLATTAFLAGVRAADLLALMPPSSAARFCADAGLSQAEYLSAMRWLANHFAMQHHTEQLARRTVDTAPAAAASMAAPANQTNAGLLT
jgi:hypothetical protein